MLDGLWFGLQGALDLRNLFAVVIGCFVGTVVGVLPGIGPTGTMALLLPLTFALGPTGGMIMLAGIWYGAQYGGSTTSILVNVPGEAASVVTCLDGHQMARKGRAGAALAIAAIGSFVAGTIGVLGLTLFPPPPGECRSELWPPRILLDRVAGSSFIIEPEWPVNTQSAAHGHAGGYSGHGRNGSHLRAPAFQHGIVLSVRRVRICSGHHGTFWSGRNSKLVCGTAEVLGGF